MSIQKNQRALVVISQLTKGVRSNQKWLYRFIESSGRSVVESILKDDYGEYVTIYDSSATKSQLLNILQDIGAKANIKAIDLILMLHGYRNKLAFHDGTYNTESLASEISGLNLRDKLRMAYSTACYGASHSDDLLNAGFKAVIGSIGINANSAVEFPTLLQLWAFGSKLKDALAIAESPITRWPADEAAREYARISKLSWVNKVNSDKVLRGDGNITIRTSGGI